MSEFNETGTETLNTAAEAVQESPALDKNGKPQKSVGQEILSWILTIVVAVLAALVIRTFIFEPVKVDGHSMDDTLADGEIMFVSKFDYASFWLMSPFGSEESKREAGNTCPKWSFFGDPKRFDVVICRYPDRGDTNFVKRVIGLPGDTVELRSGVLYVNGEMYEETYINDDYRTGYSNNFLPYTVPEGTYFVMGDHRNNSNDSRFVGPITRDMIIGHVRQVVFPFNKWRAVQ